MGTRAAGNIRVVRRSTKPLAVELPAGDPRNHRVSLDEWLLRQSGKHLELIFSQPFEYPGEPGLPWSPETLVDFADLLRKQLVLKHGLPPAAQLGLSGLESNNPNGEPLKPYYVDVAGDWVDSSRAGSEDAVFLDFDWMLRIPGRNGIMLRSNAFNGEARGDDFKLRSVKIAFPNPKLESEG
jgi:hypothetical protein